MSERRQPNPEPGPCRDCCTCTAWQPSAIVVRGNTLGWCRRWGQAAPADDTCTRHETMLIPRVQPQD